MRLTRKLLVIAVGFALAVLLARRWCGAPAEQGQAASPSTMSPEETKRLVEQALAQPRKTVRFRLDPSPSADQGAVPVPPSLAPVTAPPPALAGPAQPSVEPEPALQDRHRDKALQALHEAFAKMGRMAKMRVPGSSIATPAIPAQAPSTDPGSHRLP